MPGLRERALRFHTPADAMELRNHLIDALENAHHTVDAQERREWLTFVVGGGGDTGVELAATIRNFLQVGLLAEYPGSRMSGRGSSSGGRSAWCR